MSSSEARSLAPAVWDALPFGARLQGVRTKTTAVDAPPTVSVVIPTLNEAENIGQVLSRIPSWIHQVIVIDGHSADGTAEVVSAGYPDAEIIRQTEKGKGNALALGFAAARGEIIVMLDADGSTDPGEIPRFVAALRTGADFAKGTRFVTGGGSSDFTRSRKLGNQALACLVNHLWHQHFSDLCYGYIAFWRRCLPSLHVDVSGFEVETLLNIKAARSGLAIVEVPSFESNRLSGESNLNARRDGIRVLRTIVAEKVRPV